VLVLVTILVLASLPGPVQASPVRQYQKAVDYLLTLEAWQKGGRPGTICVGEQVTYGVTATRTGYDESGRPVGTGYPMSGVKVWASSSQSTILSLQSASPIVTSAEAKRAWSGFFTFIAKKPGTTKLIFKANMPAGYLSQQTRQRFTADELKTIQNVEARVVATVIDCQMRVRIIERFEATVEGEGSVDWVGVMDWIGLQPIDTEKTQFQAQSKMTVVYRQWGGECSFSLSIGQPVVDIEARKTDQGYDISYTKGDVYLNEYIRCPEGSGYAGFPLPDVAGSDFSVGPQGGPAYNAYEGPGFKIERLVLVLPVPTP
jgi:hypothetical protein